MGLAISERQAVEEILAEEQMDLNTLIQQLPNFAGLLICVAVLVRIIQKQQTMIEHLVDVIVKRENCEDDDG